MNLLSDILPNTDQGQMSLIVTLVVTNIVQLITNLAQMVNGIYTRREDRADRKLELEQLNHAGAMREQKIVSEVQKQGAAAEHALKVANNHNEKIANVVTAVETLAKQPRIEITNKRDLSLDEPS